MTRELPRPGFSGADEHAAMSQRLLEHAKTESDKGNRLQTSEKVWGTVAHALKSIGEKRGWNHQHPPNLMDISI